MLEHKGHGYGMIGEIATRGVSQPVPHLYISFHLQQLPQALLFACKCTARIQSHKQRLHAESSDTPAELTSKALLPSTRIC